MELSWLSRIRLALAIATGVILLAILAQPLIAQSDPYSPATLYQYRISIPAVLALAGLAFAAGFIAYFLAWPYGREMAVAAAPAGLAVIGASYGSLANLFQMSPAAPDRIAAYATFRWEGFVWLAVTLAGIAGCVLARFIRQPAPESRPKAVDPADAPINRKPAVMLNVFLALCLSTAVAYICLIMFVKAVSTPSPTGPGSVSAQPMVAQIGAGVAAAFAIAAFLTKLLFGFDWSIAVAVTAVVNFAVMTLAGNPALVRQMAETWPAATFAQPIFTILPIQMISFGVLGSLLGYWLGVRYNIWRKEVKVV